jgi:hypothetical protein
LIIDLHYRYLDPSRDEWFSTHDCIPFLQGVWRKYAATRIQVVDNDHDHNLLEKDLDFCDCHDHKSDEEKENCKKEQEETNKCNCVEELRSDSESD